MDGRTNKQKNMVKNLIPLDTFCMSGYKTEPKMTTLLKRMLNYGKGPTLGAESDWSG